MSFVTDLKAFVDSRYPFWSESFQPDENVVCDKSVTLSSECYKKIQNFVSHIYSIRNQREYSEPVLKAANLPEQKQLSVLMSFDFHIVDDFPRLIEINTNASFALPSAILNQFRFGPNNFLDELRGSFESEMRRFGRQNINSLWIVDDKPSEQKAFFEFKMYKALFEHWGIKSQILDVGDLRAPPPDFIYNRHTDFLLEKAESHVLREWFLEKRSCVSPQPCEYVLLADKKFLNFLSNSEALSKLVPPDVTKEIHRIVPETRSVASFDPDELWKARKKYFFKPEMSYGSRAVYDGKSITKGKFAEVLQESYVVQETVVPPKIGEWKWDLRCYVYNGVVQQSIARFYQGQVTNFKTPGGGLAAVEIRP